jgi:hypothetical protein
MSCMMDLGLGERTSDELEGRVSDKQGEYSVSKISLLLILAQSRCVLCRLSLPLFIGGQVSRNRSGSIQIDLHNTNHNTTLSLLIIHGTLLEQASGVLTTWASAFIPLSPRMIVSIKKAHAISA